jgi:hypothetical protein
VCSPRVQYIMGSSRVKPDNKTGIYCFFAKFIFQSNIFFNKRCRATMVQTKAKQIHVLVLSMTQITIKNWVMTCALYIKWQHYIIIPKPSYYYEHFFTVSKLQFQVLIGFEIVKLLRNWWPEMMKGTEWMFLLGQQLGKLNSCGSIALYVLVFLCFFFIFGDHMVRKYQKTGLGP